MEQTERLSFLDRNLSFFIFAAMLTGVTLGYLFSPERHSDLIHGSLNGILAVGLILMMYPPLARVKYEKMIEVFPDLRTLFLSLFLNWVIGPCLMFVLAITWLAGYPEEMTGLILIGLARCIAMVIVWNDLAKGDREHCAFLVAFNSLFQLFTFPIYAYFFISFLPGLLGLQGSEISVSVKDVARTTFLYLGVPFLGGLVTRIVGIKLKGREWYESVLMPKLAPLTLGALLFTIFVMFFFKGGAIVTLPMRAMIVAIPLCLYFLLMFAVSIFISIRSGISYEKTASLSLTAASNNFELAIAISVAVYGLGSPQAFVAIMGPLVEVPVLLGLVKVLVFLKKRYFIQKELPQNSRNQKVQSHQ